MGTTAASVLDERLSKKIGDWLETALTTALTTSKALTSTNFNIYDEGNDNHFVGQWAYITNFANIGEDRKISTYATTSGVGAVFGVNFVSDSADKATVRISHDSYTAHIRAINDAIRELYPSLHRSMEDRTLVTGQILPDNSFELWTTSSTPSLYSASANATLARTTTAGLIRGAPGTTSMKVTTSATNQYAYINSDNFPRLLDLKGQTIDMAVWAYPSTTDDAFMDVVYTEDGSSTTVSTTTSCTASLFTLLTRDRITIPSGIEKIEFRFRVSTSGQNAYFDSSRVNGESLRDYLLLSDFADGNVAQVYIQSTGYSDVISDDLYPRYWDRVFGYDTYSDGTYLWLKLPYMYSGKRQIRVIGTSPLSTLSSFTGTTEIDGREIDLLLAYAAYCLFRNEEGVPSSEDTGRFRSRAQKWLREYQRLLPSLRMIPPSGTMKLARI